MNSFVVIKVRRYRPIRYGPGFDMYKIPILQTFHVKKSDRAIPRGYLFAVNNLLLNAKKQNSQIGLNLKLDGKKLFAVTEAVFLVTIDSKGDILTLPSFQIEQISFTTVELVKLQGLQFQVKWRQVLLVRGSALPPTVVSASVLCICAYLSAQFAWHNNNIITY